MSYFPCLIMYLDKNEYVVVTHPDKIDNGRTFKVIANNVEVK